MKVNQMQSAKLNFVNSKLGNDNASQQQQSTRFIYDTETLAGGQAVLFQNFAGKGLNETNVEKSKLDSEESFVIKEIVFSGFDANQDTPVLINVYVGGQLVVKSLPIFFFQGIFNHENFVNQVSPFNVFSARLLTNIVVPPSVEIKVEVKTTTTQTYDARVGLSGFGVLFNPKNTL